MKDFKYYYPDYPQIAASLYIEACCVSDAEIPSGNGGINKERYTYGQLRHQPIINELLGNINNPHLKRFAEECNSRNAVDGFRMFKVEEEYCFWGLRVGPVVKVPALIELREYFSRNYESQQAFNEHRVTSAMVRKITYAMLHSEIARRSGMSEKEAELAIGNQLDCAPHEDISGYIFMVPNWAHRWFRHDGYVSNMRRSLNL